MDKSAVREGRPVCFTKVVTKKERINEDIKEFAETTMNELLGWYGYAKDREPTRTGSCKSQSNSNSSGPDSPKFTEGCGWCGKVVDESNALSSGSAMFCSELCFSQSRRANFKKNKTCDWCRHVRHTVSYVDFQDGASQLQFCSDKCLNQYKMQIFCRETRAHLEMHPHLVSEDSASGLITPDLWMKNCKSPHSRTPSPLMDENRPQTSPLPLITVAHPSKLLASPPDMTDPKGARPKSAKRIRKRIPSTITTFPKISETPQDLRIRHSPVSFEPQEKLADNVPHDVPSSCMPERPFINFPSQFPPDPRFLHAPMFNQPPFPMHLRPPPPSLLPPVTVMVPYPIMVPIPIPIPIPLPLSCFVKAAELKNKTDSSQNADEPTANNSSQVDEKDEGEIIVDDIKEIKISPTTSIRPLRKRKRVVDSKNKIIIKSKKPLSV